MGVSASRFCDTALHAEKGASNGLEELLASSIVLDATGPLILSTDFSFQIRTMWFGIAVSSSFS